MSNVTFSYLDMFEEQQRKRKQEEELIKKQEFEEQYKVESKKPAFFQNDKVMSKKR
jgi:hypothetical protein